MLPIPNTGAFTSVDVSVITAILQANQWTGNTYYVDPVNGLDLNNGQQAQATPGQQGTGPVKTLAAGYGLLVSGNNDTLAIISNGATTGTARLDVAFTWAKNGCRLIGICAPTRISQRARIAPTGTTIAFTPFFTISGTGNLFQNLQWFHGFNAGGVAQICMVISGGRNVFKNCDIDGMGDAASAADAGSRSLKFVANGDENLFQDCSVGLDTIARGAANATLEFSGGCTRNIFENVVFPFDASAATPLGIKIAAAAGSDRYQLFNQCLFINAIQSTAVAMTGLCTLAAAMGGMLVMKNCTIIGITSFGSDATSKGQIYVDGAAVSSSTGIGVNPV
jgi:hypothetical protein